MRDKERDKKVGAAVKALWSRLLGIRNNESWKRKLLAASYLHHRDDYPGTSVEHRQTYSTDAVDFLGVFHDGFIGYLMPQDDTWADLVPESASFGKRNGERKREYADLEALDGVEGLLPYAEKCVGAVMAEYASSAYYDQASMAAWDWLIFAVAYFMAVDDPEEGDVGFMCFDPQEVCIAENWKRQPDVFVRHFYMDACDVVRAYPDAEIKTLRDRVENGGGERSDVEMYEVILPRKYLWSGKENLECGPEGMKFAHVIWCESENEIVSESGYEAFPVACARYKRTNSVTPYGKSLAEENLDAIVQLDDMERTRQIMWQKNANPPMAAPHSLQGRYSSRPGAINYVPDMNQRPAPILEGFNYTQMLSDIQDKRERLRQSLKADLFRNVMAMTDSRKTAYEVSERKNEAMTLLLMSIGSFKREFIDPVFFRTISIMNKKGKIPPIEKVYADNTRRTGKAVESRSFDDFLKNCRIELSSVFVQRVSAYLQYEGLMAGVNILTSLVEIFPTARFQIYEDKLTRHLLYGCTFPRSLIRPQKEAKKAEKEYADMQKSQFTAENKVQNTQAEKNQADALRAMGGGGAA